MKGKKKMARKKEGRREEREEAAEDFAPEQMGVDEEGQPEFSLQPKAKKDPTEVEFKHSYVVETPETYGKSKGEKEAKKSKASKTQEPSEKERDEDFWYVG